MVMSSISRHVARTVFNVRALVGGPGVPCLTARALSYTGWQSRGRGGGGAGAPWGGHGGGGDDGAMAGWSDRPPRRVIERRPGDWDCAECGNHVFASRAVCPRCQTPKPFAEGEAATGASGAGLAAYSRLGGGMDRRQGQPVPKRPGDWDCPLCQFHNFASRQECYRCQEPRPMDAEVFGHEGGGRFGGGGGFEGGGGAGGGGAGGGGAGGGWASVVTVG
eukprot:g10202.t1